MRKTKIICTIGPSSNNEETLKQMMLSGMNVCRLNFSHGNGEDQEDTVNLINKLRNELNLPISLLLDTKGPEIRIKKFKNDKIFLNENDTFILTCEDIIGDSNKVSITYDNLYNDVTTNSIILLDDGLIKLEVKEIINKDIICKVLVGGELSNNKSINIPNLKLNLPSLTEKDINDIKYGIEHDFDYIAASFVQKADDVIAIKKILDDNNGSHIKVISKIENQAGVNNFDEILKVSDGIMVARGDLGVEVEMDKVPVIQKYFIKKAYTSGKIVITATQMLESMINNPTPTRAETSDVANAIYDGTSAIMLSGETATGKYPIECIKTMNRIANTVEKSIKYWKRFKLRPLTEDDFEFKIDQAMCASAMNTNAKAIYCFTKTSNTPRIITSFTPQCPIVAITKNKKLYHQLGLFWGVIPKLYNGQEEKTRNIIIDSLYKDKANNELNEGGIIIIAGGQYVYEKYDSIINKSIGGIFQV